MNPNCTCGHTEDEHGGTLDAPSAMGCLVEGCECFQYEEDFSDEESK